MGMLRRLHAFIRSSILLATENIVTDLLLPVPLH